MFPGVAPAGRGPPPGRGGIPPGPGRGPPGTCGRGIGRSTGWAEENGLLPTRGGRGPPGLGAAGPGRGPGAASGAGVATGATGATTGAAGAAGTGAVGLATAGAGGAVATAPTSAAAWTGAGFAAAFAGAFCGALAPPKDSRNRRATGASTVDDADLTNSPCSLRRARTSLLVTPSSLANSCTRALPATTSPSLEATAVGGPRLGFSYDAWSSGLHGVLIVLRYLFSPGWTSTEMLDHRGWVRCTGDAQRSTEGPPPQRCREATLIGVQPGTPARV